MRGRLLAVLVVATLVLAACGSRVPEDEIRAAAGGTGSASAGAGVATGPTTSAATGDPVMFGTLPSPCGPGDASGATDVGVTDDAITIVAVADPGGPSPGLNQGVLDTMEAFGAWCNEQGGINGRRLDVMLADAKLTEYQAVVTGACDSALALVGGIAVLDQTGVPTQTACGIPNVPAAAVSAEQVYAPNTFQPLPNPQDRFQIGGQRWVSSQHPDAIGAAAALRTKLSITETQSDRMIEALEPLGFDFTYVEASSVGETNWAPFVLAMKERGIRYVTLTSSYEEIIPLQKEMALQGLDAVVELNVNFYNAKYPRQAGEVADGTYIDLTVWPFEEAEDNPAMAEYLRALRAAVPDTQPEELGVQSWSAALLWATAMKNLGSDVTREALVAELETITSWDGGGLHGETDPANQVPSDCIIVMQVRDGGFVRAFPLPDRDAEVFEAGNGFSCSPENNASLSDRWAPAAGG
jgi:ABC-type branched-subunit amino acid transport system substrate-binding protein